MTNGQRLLIRVALERYRSDIRTACLEDQGTPEGEPGTIGHSVQREIDEILLLDELRAY